MSTIIGKVKGGVENTFSTVQGKIQLKNLLCSLRAQIKILEKERAEQIVILGQTLYQMHRDGNIDLDAIQILLRGLDDIEQRLVNKHREEEACAATLYGDDHASAESPAAGGCTCTCGARMSSSAKFCSECGRPASAQAGPENEPQRGWAHPMPPPALSSQPTV